MYVLPPQLNEGLVSITRKFRNTRSTLPKAWLSKYIQKTEAPVNSNLMVQLLNSI